MKFLFTSFLLCIMSLSVHAGPGGYISLTNGTSDDWILNYSHSYQLNSWGFPVTIPAGSEKTIYVEYETGLFISTGDTRAEAFYLIGNTGNKVEIRTTYQNFGVTLIENGGTKSTLSPLGFRHDGYVNYIVSESDDNYYPSGSSMADWMKNTLPTIQDKKLINICIPGSHDAGMSQYGTHTAAVSECNTITQVKSIYDQLLLGTRYFDIRPVQSGGIYKTGHYGEVLGVWQGANGQSIADIITDINNFTSSHQELIILNISHTLNTDGDYSEFNETKYAGLFDSLYHINYLFNRDNDIKNLYNLKIHDFIGFGTSSVLIVCEDTIIKTSALLASKYLNNKVFYETESLKTENYYSGTNDLNVMKNDQLNKMNSYLSNYFLLSWTLTQSNFQAFNCNDILVPSQSILDLASDANQRLPHFLMESITPLIYPNIIYTDRIEDQNSALLSIYINKNSRPKEITPTNILENGELNQVLIYPNPNQGTVNINIGNLTDVSVKLEDLFGRLVFQEQNTKTSPYTLEINGAPGIYIIEFAKGTAKKQFKLVKE